MRVAETLGVEIQLRSAPGAAASVGAGYLHGLEGAVGQELLIDCHDDAGLVMAALRAGCRKLIFSGPVDLLRRLDQMALKRGAVVQDAKFSSPPCLDLSPDDGEAAIRPWLVAVTRI